MFSYELLLAYRYTGTSVAYRPTGTFDTDRTKNNILKINFRLKNRFFEFVQFSVAYRTTGTSETYRPSSTRDSTKNDFLDSYNSNRTVWFRTERSTVRYGWIYTVRYGFLSLVWFGIFPNASLLHVSLVGTRGRDVPLREIANSTSLVRRLNYAIPSKRFALPNKYIGGGI